MIEALPTFITVLTKRQKWKIKCQLFRSELVVLSYPCSDPYTTCCQIDYVCGIRKKIWYKYSSTFPDSVLSHYTQRTIHDRIDKKSRVVIP